MIRVTTKAFSKDDQQQYEALTEASGFYALRGWSQIRVTGEDRQQLLNNLCTSDVTSLTVGSGCEAFCTDVKGKVLAHLFVLCLEQSLELIAVPELSDTLIQHLDRYVIREDVQLADVSSDSQLYQLSESAAKHLLSRLSATDGEIPQQAWENRGFQSEEFEGLAIKFPVPAVSSFLLRIPRHAQDRWTSLLEESSIQECHAEAWNALRIESGWPLQEVDFSSRNLPQEINRDARAVNFTKGCYLGQETVARIDALGHVNKKLVGVVFEEDQVPEVGTSLTVNKKEVGTVTSSSWSPRLEAPLALAMVRRGANEPGTALEGGEGNGRVVALPLDRNGS